MEAMRRRIVELLIVSLVACAGSAGCSRSGNKSAESEGDAREFDSWKPAKEAIQSAKREKDAAAIVVRSTRQPRASAYDLNPRAATAPHENAATAIDSANEAEAGDEDPALGGMEKLPPPPMPPKLASGDEADQFGLPEWERMARGELHVKRIRY
jgi:hypothetical protein